MRGMNKLWRKIRVAGRGILVTILVCGLSVCFIGGRTACAAEAGGTDLAAAAEARKKLPVQSNETPGWPAGPAITAQAAILMEADTGTILYAKNIHEQNYPASTTKILTCLLAVEEGSLTDEVRFSEQAVLSLPPGSSNIGIDPGEALPLETALYGILVGSANEVSNAVGEYIAGSIPAFVERMNERARALGCTDSHFANTNGLPDKTHLTSAYDLAVIARAFFDHPLLARISGTDSYHFTKTATQKDDFTIRNKHKLVNGDIPYEGIVGGKTGYTDGARETLVTCAERDGLRLICVVFKEESPAQFTDTVTLFDYGFNNFRVADVAQEETRFLPGEPPFGNYLTDIFGSASAVLSIDRSSRVILPTGVRIEDTDAVVSYDDPDIFARIDYRWHDIPIGSAAVLRKNSALTADPKKGFPRIVTLRLFYVLPWIWGSAFSYCLLVTIITLLKSWHFGGLTISERRKLRRKRRESRRERVHLDE